MIRKNRRFFNNRRRLNESYFDDYFTEYKTLDNYTELDSDDNQILSTPSLDAAYSSEPTAYRNQSLNYDDFDYDYDDNDDNEYSKPESNVLDTFYQGSDDRNISKSQKLLESCERIMNSDKPRRNRYRCIR